MNLLSIEPGGIVLIALGGAAAGTIATTIILGQLWLVHNSARERWLDRFRSKLRSRLNRGHVAR